MPDTTPDTTPPSTTAVPNAPTAPAAAPAEPVATDAPAVAPAPVADATPPDWALKRIDKLTKDKRTAEEEAEQLRQRLAALESGQGDPVPTPAATGLTQADVDRLANEKLAQAQFTNRCNDIFHAGEKEYTDFQATIRNFSNIGGLPQDLVQAAIEFDEPHKLLYALGKNLNEAMRLSQMTAVQKAVALSKMEKEMNKTPVVSRAPEPAPTVVNGGGAAPGQVDLNDKNLSMDDYVAERERQRSQRKRR